MHRPRTCTPRPRQRGSAARTINWDIEGEKSQQHALYDKSDTEGLLGQLIREKWVGCDAAMTRRAFHKPGISNRTLHLAYNRQKGPLGCQPTQLLSLRPCVTNSTSLLALNSNELHFDAVGTELCRGGRRGDADEVLWFLFSRRHDANWRDDASLAVFPCQRRNECKVASQQRIHGRASHIATRAAPRLRNGWRFVRRLAKCLRPWLAVYYLACPKS